MIKVAVLMAAFNGERWIGRQIHSILDQVGVCVTVFVHVDPSTDRTHEICGQIASIHDNVFVVSHDNASGGAAANFYRAIKSTAINDYEYYAFADQDDVWMRTKLRSGIDLLLTNDAHGYSSDVLAWWPASGKREIVRKSYRQQKFDHLFEGPGPGCTFILTQCLFAHVSRKLTEASRHCFQLPHWHDWAIYAIAREGSFRWVIDKECHMLYRQHDKNEVGANIGFRSFVNRVFMTIYMGLDETLLIRDLCACGTRRVSNQDKWMIIVHSMRNFNSVRRRPRDRVLALVACLFLAINLVCKQFSIGNHDAILKDGS